MKILIVLNCLLILCACSVKAEDKNELSSIIDEYCANIDSQQNNQLSVQPIYISFFINNEDTTIRIFTDRIVFQPINNDFCYLYKFNVNQHDVYILNKTDVALDKKLLINIPNLTSLNCTIEGLEPPPPYVNIEFKNSSWKYKIKDGKFIKVKMS